jgi:hypothetical protein
VDECRQLLSLYRDKDRESADVKAITEAKLAETDRKITELVGLRKLLHNLVEHCHGDERSDCPIIDELAGEGLVQRNGLCATVIPARACASGAVLLPTSAIRNSRRVVALVTSTK